MSKAKLKKRLWDYTLLVIGSVIIGLGYALFINPYDIVPGGFIALGLIINDIIPAIPVGMFAMALNLPVLFLGFKLLGPRFGVKTIVGIIITSLIIDGIDCYLQSSQIFEVSDPLGLAEDLLLSVIFGSIFIGAGLGLVYRTGATTGGTDVIAAIIAKHARMSMGQGVMIADAMVVLAGLFVFQDWKVPLYSLLSIYVIGQTINIMMNGFKFDSALFIISEKHQEIRDKIINDIQRGGTFLKGEGMYTGNDKHVIFVVLSRREIPIIKSFVHSIDPDAFVTIIDTRQTLGDGFKPLKSDDELSSY